MAGEEDPRNVPPGSYDDFPLYSMAGPDAYSNNAVFNAENPDSYSPFSVTSQVGLSVTTAFRSDYNVGAGMLDGFQSHLVLPQHSTHFPYSFPSNESQYATVQGHTLTLSHLTSPDWTDITNVGHQQWSTKAQMQSSDAIEDYIDFEGCADSLTQRPESLSRGNDVPIQSPLSTYLSPVHNNSTIFITAETLRDSTVFDSGSSSSDESLEVTDDIGGNIRDITTSAGNTPCGSLSPSDSSSTMPILAEGRSTQQGAERHKFSKDMKCTHCGREFSKNHQLNKHILTHTKPYKCAIEDCAYAASVQRDLTRHQATVHQIGAGFFCDVPGCDRARDAEVLHPFGRHDNLKRHARTMHGIELLRG